MSRTASPYRKALRDFDLDAGLGIQALNMMESGGAAAAHTLLRSPLGHLTDAAKQLHDWLGSGALPGPFRLSVNVSHQEFWHEAYADTLAAVLYAAAARAVLERLRALGVHLPVDDFGTGYSSLEALHHFPIGAPKIDRSFVSRLGMDARSAELVRTIITMAGNLGLEVIAEGIDDENQRVRLRDMGCVLSQGFLFSPARAASELTLS